MQNPKLDRQKQWNCNSNFRGWKRFRSTTFLEFINAKIDRALQSIHLINSIKHVNYSELEVTKLEADGLDSIIDARNYLDELITRCGSDKAYFSKMEMP